VFEKRKDFSKHLPNIAKIFDVKREKKKKKKKGFDGANSNILGGKL
jgi:uncharacterized C2H2 Zn-finger protein